MRIAILDDYQSVALAMADWTPLQGRAQITVFRDHLADRDALVARLEPFNILVIMRERTPLPGDVLRRLPNLRMIASTGARNASIDTAAAAELGVAVLHTGYDSTPTIEHAWALIMASARDLVTEAASVRAGGWQRGVGVNLRSKTLGLLGVGKVGSEVARIGSAFGMQVIAWSPHLTPERAAAAGLELVDQTGLFDRADVLSIHLVLGDETRGIVNRSLLERMKPTARLINTSRGPLVDEAALVDMLRQKRIAGAAIDVFETEPLPADHPFRSLPNVLATPHMGYVSQEMYRTFYGDTVRNIAAWLDQAGHGAKAP